MNLIDVTDDGTKDGNISLSKLAGSKVVDVLGYISNEFGELTFVMSRVVLEDGRQLFLGGEHDMPYVEDEIVADEELEKLYREVNGGGEENDEDED